MNNVINNLIQICFSSIGGFIGSVIGLISATIVWNIVEFEYQKLAATLTFISVFALCVVIGIYVESINRKVE
jgi:nicotinamide riboside transporter PnuC